MPAYIQSPFKPMPQLLVPGTPSYLWGKYNDKTGPTMGRVLSDSATGTTATLTFEIISGNIPIAGALITVISSANSSGIFNVTNATILTVSAPANPDAGVYSVTYAISATSQATTADGGQVMIPQPEVGEALSAGASAPVAMPFNIMGPNFNQALTVVASFPSLPTSVVLTLQQAVQDIDSEYQAVAVIATVAGGSVTTGPQITVDPTLGRFFRVLNGTVVGGTLPTVIVKILL